VGRALTGRQAKSRAHQESEGDSRRAEIVQDVPTAASLKRSDERVAAQAAREHVELRPGERVAIEAIDPITVQSVLGFVAEGPPPAWQVERETADAVVLTRKR